jgi:hypothetical protein
MCENGDFMRVRVFVVSHWIKSKGWVSGRILFITWNALFSFHRYDAKMTL